MSLNGGYYNMGILKDMKKLYPDLMKQSDKFRKIPLQNYLRLPDVENNVDSQRRLKFLRQFYAFVFTSGLIQNVAIQWVQTSLTVKELKEQIDENIPDEEKRTYRWYNGKIAYDNKKIRDYFQDEGMIEKVQRYAPDHSSKGYDLSKYETELKNAQAKLQPKSVVLKDCVLDLKQSNYCKIIGDAEFEAVLQLIRLYSERSIKLIQESIPTNIKGYLNYIQSVQAQNLSDEDNKRYNRLTKTLEQADINSLPGFSLILKSTVDSVESDVGIDMSTFKES